MEPFCCLENTSCTFAALWPRQFPLIYVIQFGFVWFCRIRLDLCGTMTFNANVRAIPFSRPNVPKSIHFFLYMLKLAIF